MKKIILFIIVVILLGGIGFGIYKIYNKIQEDKTAWKVQITNDYINLRKDHSQYEALLGKVTKGEKYQVLEIYLEENTFVWYKIEANEKIGWIASSRTKPYVKEINNPNAVAASDPDIYKVDYKNPVVKFFDEKYYTESIDTISYNHLEITDDSEYTITSEIYIEECSTYHQYWITYSVVDEFDNKTELIQCVVFEQEPPRNKVKDLSEIRNSVCVEKR